MDHIMDIQFDRRHAFYLDPNNHLHPISPYHLDRLWRGHPDAAIPELAHQRARFAILHTERFTTPPRILLEQYLVLPLNASGSLDPCAHQAQLTAEADHLEAADFHPTTRSRPPDLTTWWPDLFTRHRLLTAIQGPPRLTAPRPLTRTAA